MTEQTAQRFALDESKAAEWLRRVIARGDWEMGGEGDEPEAPEGDDLPTIASDWEPRQFSQESEVWRLVRAAVDGGIIDAPEGIDLDFEYVADDDGGYYYFLVLLPHWLKLASDSEEMRKLGDREARGLDAALAILREAEWMANATLARLDKYRPAAPRTGLRPELLPLSRRRHERLPDRAGRAYRTGGHRAGVLA